ncbi:Yip1 family protein [Phenylobacterium sp.]|jgi:hypothetical protein|uniref:Yip1 family protein n=1 Tax=Phenylobacterium sp. TaxID=1871053 RepID=UPI002F958112
MAAVEPEKPRSGLIGRALDMVLRPQAAWRAVAAEPSDIGEVYLRYVLPLAAIPPVAGFLGIVIFGGIQIASIGVRPSLMAAAVEAVAAYGLTLILTYVLALVVDALAPRFGGQADRTRAFKLVAYSGTGLWLAGALALYPTLSFPAVILGALYSLYLLYTGLPRLMRIEEGRAITCFAVVLLAVVLLAALKGFLAARAMELGGPLMAG